VPILLRAGIAIAALGAMLAVFASSPPSAADDLPTLRIGTTPIDAGAEPYFAKQIGLFKRAGINVEITAMSNGSALAAAVASGAIDIAQSNVVSIATAHARGIPFVLIAPASLYTYKAPQSALVVTANSPIRSAKDLNGKTIAVSGLRNISQLGPEAWIAQNGGDLASVKFIEMPFSEMEDALNKGRVDAALISEPSLTAAYTHGARLLANAYDAIGKDFLIGAWFTTSSWANAHPDLVRKYVAVMRETARWANTHHSESARILEAETNIPVTSLTQRVIFGETLAPIQIQPTIDACAKYGLVNKDFPADEIIFSVR
jgi:NitT/TauT family transport system substrate-binding protein